MAVIGTRHSSTVTRQMMAAFPGAQQAVLAAAQPLPYYHTPVTSPQDVQPDRPIGYGAFGVVW